MTNIGAGPVTIYFVLLGFRAFFLFGSALFPLPLRSPSSLVMHSVTLFLLAADGRAVQHSLSTYNVRQKRLWTAAAFFTLPTLHACTSGTGVACPGARVSSSATTPFPWPPMVIMTTRVNTRVIMKTARAGRWQPRFAPSKRAEGVAGRTTAWRSYLAAGKTSFKSSRRVGITLSNGS